MIIHYIYEFEQFIFEKDFLFSDMDNLSALNKPKHIFLFIIDALRYDHVAFNNNGDDNNTNGVFNQFKFIHQLLENNSSQTYFNKFYADPPTVTSQRLKGLMSGVMPTFLEIGNNFNSIQSMEDSWIDQLQRNKKM